MRYGSIFGIGSESLVRAGHMTGGVVSKVRTLRFIRVNTKAFRTGSGDGALHPHLVTYRYEVDGGRYFGMRYIGVSKNCPEEGAEVAVFYDWTDPSHSTILI